MFDDIVKHNGWLYLRSPHAHSAQIHHYIYSKAPNLPLWINFCLSMNEDWVSNPTLLNVAFLWDTCLDSYYASESSWIQSKWRVTTYLSSLLLFPILLLYERSSFFRVTFGPSAFWKNIKFIHFTMMVPVHPTKMQLTSSRVFLRGWLARISFQTRPRTRKELGRKNMKGIKEKTNFIKKIENK